MIAMSMIASDSPCLSIIDYLISTIRCIDGSADQPDGPSSLGFNTPYMDMCMVEGNTH